MTLSTESLAGWAGRLTTASARIARDFPGEGPDRQPVHTVYGGAHLFSADTAGRLGQLGLESMDRWCADSAELASILDLPHAIAHPVYAAVRDKLMREPVEDFRLDFEDGYGNRSDDEEDGHARSAALQLAAGTEAGSLPPFTGIRIKSLTGELHRRALRTLDILVTALAEAAGTVPQTFVVTIPKIQDIDQVKVVAEALAELEAALGLAPIQVELMMETPQMVVDRDGSSGVRKFVDAAGGRVRGVHFGTYDYTASLNITAAHQTMSHPACDFARHDMQASLAGTGIWISDGATNVMPVAVHRGNELTDEQEAENRETVHRAMRLHFDHVRHSLSHAFYQGWDLHPAQLATRYAAVYSFFLEGLDQAGERLTNFVESAAKATLVGEVFDDAATGQGLLNYFLRAVNCGAISEDEATRRSGLTLAELHSRSFLRILEGRR